jgi:hypothetical protein
MLGRWADLWEQLARYECWDVTALATATLLLGGRPDLAAADPTATHLFAAVLAAYPDPRGFCAAWSAAHPGRSVDAAFTRAWPLKEALGNRAAGRAALGRLVDGEVARLEDHKRAVLAPQAALERAAAVDRAMFDDSHAGVLLRRYETACEREYHKALAEVLKFRKERPPAVETSAEPEPPVDEPVDPVQNEPIAETVESQGVVGDVPAAEPVAAAAPSADIHAYADLTPSTPENGVKPPRLAAV